MKKIERPEIGIGIKATLDQQTFYLFHACHIWDVIKFCVGIYTNGVFNLHPWTNIRSYISLSFVFPCPSLLISFCNNKPIQDGDHNGNNNDSNNILRLVMPMPIYRIQLTVPYTSPPQVDMWTLGQIGQSVTLRIGQGVLAQLSLW